MNKNKFEGGVRSAAGAAERSVSAAADDKASDVRGAYDQVAGSAQSAWSSAKEAAKNWPIPVQLRICPSCATTSRG